MSRGYRLGFETQREEREERLPVEGDLPDWLAGRYLKNGPGQFEVGDRALRHWFDPLAMVRGFGIDGAAGEVRYRNRYVRSRDFEYAREHGKVRTPFPGTPPDRSLPTRVWQTLAGVFPDNPVIGVARIGGRVAAITESPWALELDGDLDTVGRRDLTAGLDADLTLGHPHYDPGRGALVNLGVSYGRRTEFTLLRRDAATGEATPTATVAADDVPYVHSFALTDRYAVVPATPFGLDPTALLLGAVTKRTFLDSFVRFDRDARFVVIDREDGAVVAEPAADPFFVYHHANAYPDGDELVVDLIAYPDERAVTDLTVANLRGADPAVPQGDLVRYRLPLDGGRATRETLREGQIEFPAIHYPRYAGREYRYVYAVETERGSLPTRVVKVDVAAGGATAWGGDPDLFPGEAVFVPAPDPAGEDDGVLLSLALDADAGRSVLLVLDARDLTELARAPLPHRLPYGFHGQFYRRDGPIRSMP